MNGITVAIDGSEASMRAADFAGRLSQAFDMPVNLIHAVHPEVLVAPGAGRSYERSEGVSVAPRALLLAQGEQYVSRAVGRVKSVGGRIGTASKKVGSPIKVIRDFADESGSDIVVLGSRGLGQVEGLLMGSVSHGVQGGADKTVVTVP